MDDIPATASSDITEEGWRRRPYDREPKPGSSDSRTCQGDHESKHRRTDREPTQRHTEGYVSWKCQVALPKTC